MTPCHFFRLVACFVYLEAGGVKGDDSEWSLWSGGRGSADKLPKGRLTSGSLLHSDPEPAIVHKTMEKLRPRLSGDILAGATLRIRSAVDDLGGKYSAFTLSPYLEDTTIYPSISKKFRHCSDVMKMPFRPLSNFSVPKRSYGHQLSRPLDIDLSSVKAHSKYGNPDIMTLIKSINGNLLNQHSIDSKVVEYSTEMSKSGVLTSFENMLTDLKSICSNSSALVRDLKMIDKPKYVHSNVGKMKKNIYLEADLISGPTTQNYTESPSITQSPSGSDITEEKTPAQELAPTTTEQLEKTSTTTPVFKAISYKNIEQDFQPAIKSLHAFPSSNLASQELTKGLVTILNKPLLSYKVKHTEIEVIPKSSDFSEKFLNFLQQFNSAQEQMISCTPKRDISCAGIEYPSVSIVNVAKTKFKKSNHTRIGKHSKNKLSSEISYGRNLMLKNSTSFMNENNTQDIDNLLSRIERNVCDASQILRPEAVKDLNISNTLFHSLTKPKEIENNVSAMLEFPEKPQSLNVSNVMSPAKRILPLVNMLKTHVSQIEHLPPNAKEGKGVKPKETNCGPSGRGLKCQHHHVTHATTACNQLLVWSSSVTQSKSAGKTVKEQGGADIISQTKGSEGSGYINEEKDDSDGDDSMPHLSGSEQVEWRNTVSDHKDGSLKTNLNPPTKPDWKVGFKNNIQIIGLSKGVPITVVRDMKSDGGSSNMSENILAQASAVSEYSKEVSMGPQLQSENPFKKDGVSDEVSALPISYIDHDKEYEKRISLESPASSLKDSVSPSSPVMSSVELGMVSDAQKTKVVKNNSSSENSSSILVCHMISPDFYSKRYSNNHQDRPSKVASKLSNTVSASVTPAPLSSSAKISTTPDSYRYEPFHLFPSDLSPFGPVLSKTTAIKSQFSTTGSTSHSRDGLNSTISSTTSIPVNSDQTLVKLKEKESIMKENVTKGVMDKGSVVENQTQVANISKTGSSTIGPDVSTSLINSSTGKEEVTSDH